MPNRSEMIAEIERLDHELQRLAGEIDVLRRKVDAPPRSGRTQAFGAPVPTTAPPLPRSAPPIELRHGDSGEPPAPAPSRPVKTSTRTIPPSDGPRRLASPALGLEDAPPTPSAARRRDSPVTPADMGRYGYVNEGKRPSSRR